MTTVVRSVKHKINMGHYEGIEIFASVSIDLPDEHKVTARDAKQLDSTLSLLVKDSLNEALQVTGAKNTYIQYWEQEGK